MIFGKLGSHSQRPRQSSEIARTVEGDWHASYAYFRSRLVLATVQYPDTYHIYDNMNNLAYLLMPPVSEKLRTTGKSWNVSGCDTQADYTYDGMSHLTRASHRESGRITCEENLPGGSGGNGTLPWRPGIGQGVIVDFGTRDITDYCGPLRYLNGSLDRRVTPSGYVKADTAYYFVTDHQSNVRQVVRGADGRVVQEAHYYPYGGLFGESSATALEAVNGIGENDRLFGGKERTALSDLQFLDFEARLYDPQLGMFWTTDPMMEDYYPYSYRLYCLANPVNLTDPTGCSPIYSTEGKFLGTDDYGLQGDYYIMEESNFKQNMTCGDVLKNAVDPNDLSETVINSVETHFNSLPDRPDYDGYLTLEEAKTWYQEGNGETLYVDLSKIDLSGIRSLGEGYVGQEKCVNLLTGASHSFNDGLVYGNITLKRFPDNTVRAYNDKYDFDIKPWGDPSNWIRNIETIAGSIYSGSGTPYYIVFNGFATLKPLLPWIE